MYTDEEINLITLCSFDELTYKNRHTLLNGFETSFPDFVKYEPVMIKSLSRGVYNKVKEKFFLSEYRKVVLDGLKRRGIVCVTYFSDGYPELLRQTPFPPIVLYCKGDTKLLKTRCFAAVGSRRTLPNVAKNCAKICGELTRAFTVVTGLAEGADSAAAEGAIASGKCISVLAYGFDFVYPAFNENLLQKVAQSGLVISEFTPQTSPKQYFFPIRNRIIAGLSEGVLVVSAGKKSGALITADYAAEYGRQLFAFPYGIGVSSGEGCNSLIKKGAFLTENILDIFSVFGLDFKISQPEPLSEEENALLALIKEAGEAFIPDVAAKMGRLPFQIIPLLSSLEIKGLVVRLGGNRYSAV